MSLLTVFRNRSSKRRFTKAKAEAERKGHMVCAVLKNGKPIYFTAPKTFDETEVQNTAFRVREGRAMQPAERTLLDLASRRIKQDVFHG